MMGQVAARGADIAIVTDDNPRSEDPAAIRAQVLAACPDGVEVGDRHEAIGAALSLLEPADLLVIAGKGHETGQIVGDLTHPFDDALVAREAVAAMRGVA
jgi:UDP-N-acetylmuramoyl-L-alanyl-D-glutamate--2,6-diaminopimelate ligase